MDSKKEFNAKAKSVEKRSAGVSHAEQGISDASTTEQRRRDLKLVIVLLIALFMAFLSLESCSKQAAQCPLCEREVHQGMQVKITHNKIPMQTCCMACALTYQKQTQNVEIQTATDFISGKSIDAHDAFFVIGSDVSPCIQDPKVQKFLREPHSAMHACFDRCEPGMLAFQSRADAQNFRKEHGGFIAEFRQLPAYVAVKGGSHHD